MVGKRADGGRGGGAFPFFSKECLPSTAHVFTKRDTCMRVYRNAHMHAHTRACTLWHTPRPPRHRHATGTPQARHRHATGTPQTCVKTRTSPQSLSSPRRTPGRSPAQTASRALSTGGRERSTASLRSAWAAPMESRDGTSYSKRAPTQGEKYREGGAAGEGSAAAMATSVPREQQQRGEGGTLVPGSPRRRQPPDAPMQWLQGSAGGCGSNRAPPAKPRAARTAAAEEEGGVWRGAEHKGGEKRDVLCIVSIWQAEEAHACSPARQYGACLSLTESKGGPRQQSCSPPKPSQAAPLITTTPESTLVKSKNCVFCVSCGEKRSK